MFVNQAEDQFFDSNNLQEDMSEKSQPRRSRDRSQIPQNWLNEEGDFETEQEDNDQDFQENLNYEPGSQNFETEDRESHKRNIPTPYSDPNEDDIAIPNVVNAYIPSFANNSQNLNRVPFKPNPKQPEEIFVAKKPHEFSIRLDARSLGIHQPSYQSQSQKAAAQAERQEVPTYQGQDQLRGRISELEYALRQEMLRNEETQAMNYALKQVIDEFRSTKQPHRFSKSSSDNVRISEVVSNSARKNSEISTPHFTQKNVHSEREMELKIEILNLSEKLEMQTSKNNKLQGQLQELREINEMANQDLKIAIESVRQAKSLEDQKKFLMSENQELKDQIEHLQAEEEASKILDQSASQYSRINENQLKREFKQTIDQIKQKYEDVIHKLELEHDQKIKQMSQHDDPPQPKFQQRGIMSGDMTKEINQELESLQKMNGSIRKEKLDLLTTLAEKEDKLVKLERHIEKLVGSHEQENKQKAAQIQQLIQELNQIGDNKSEVGSRSAAGKNSNSLQGEVMNLSKEVEFRDEKLRKHSFHLRMIYQTVNQILGRITGRTFIDKSKTLNPPNFQ